MSPSEFPTHAAMIAAGSVLSAIALHKGWRCWSAASWPTAAGEIIHSDTEDEVTEDREGGATTRYRAWVRYRYAVAGRNYYGRRVSFGFEWHWFAWTARWIANRYPEGKRVRVHYRDADPEDSTLETGITLAAVLVLSAGIALIAWGLRGV